jgi:hypothetical protein
LLINAANMRGLWALQDSVIIGYDDTKVAARRCIG